MHRAEEAAQSAKQEFLAREKALDFRKRDKMQRSLDARLGKANKRQAANVQLRDN